MIFSRLVHLILCLVLLVVESVTAQETVKRAISYNGECSYIMTSFDLLPDPRTDCTTHDVWLDWWLFATHVPGYGRQSSLTFDTPEFRSRVASAINSREPMKRNRTYVPFEDSDLSLAAMYEFPNDSGIVVLKYFTDIVSREAYVVLLRHSDELFVFGVRGHAKDTSTAVNGEFYEILSRQPSMFDDHPVCTALLYLRLRHFSQAGPIFVLESASQMSQILLLTRSLGQHESPLEYRTFDELFVCPETEEYCSLTGDWDSDYAQFKEFLSRQNYSDKVQFAKPEVIQEDSLNTIVRFTICDADVSNLGRWEVRFEGGFIREVRRLNAPLDGPLFDYRSSNHNSNITCFRGMLMVY